jgi:hypothetical protein
VARPISNQTVHLKPVFADLLAIPLLPVQAQARVAVALDPALDKDERSVQTVCGQA